MRFVTPKSALACRPHTASAFACATTPHARAILGIYCGRNKARVGAIAGHQSRSKAAIKNNKRNKRNKRNTGATERNKRNTDAKRTSSEHHERTCGAQQDAERVQQVQ